MTQAFRVGDRVTVPAHRAVTFRKPWRAQFQAGRIGTVVRGSQLFDIVTVEWDSLKQHRAGCTLTMTVTDLELVP